MNRDRGVEAYLARCPRKLGPKLAAIRQVIRDAEPRAEELVSYRMPGYRLVGEDGNRMFAWFALRRDHIGLYLRPPTVERHLRSLAAYETTKSTVRLPLEGDLPKELIRRLVRASARSIRAKSS